MKQRWIQTGETDSKDLLIASAVALVSFAVLLATMQMGFTRDESFYFHAAYQYIGWFEELWTNWQAGELAASFTQTNIDKHWSYNPEHPVLMKTLFALSYKVFHDLLDWTTPSTAMRIPGAVSAALLGSIVYLWARQLFGRAAGLIAVVALLAQPRFFFHSHMACFDVPVIFLWTAVVYAYWRGYESPRWAVACGVFFGLALSTKLNAFFLPIVLVGHWMWTRRREFGVAREPLRLKVPGVPWAFVAMAVIGPILFYLLWPRHWFDTTARIEWYLNFHLKHVHYFVYYLGQNIQQPPLPVSYPTVMTLVTIPATILVSFILGSIAWIHRGWKDRGVETGEDVGAPGISSTGWLMVINVVFPIALISMPETPIFGGVKHWMTAAPFIAILAAGGVSWAVARAVGAERFTAAVAVLGSLVLAPALYATHHIHPFGTSYYNEFVGGVRGAADREMMRQFWGYASRQSLPWLNEHAPKKARVWTHNTTGYAWNMYRREDQVRGDIRPSSLSGSQLSLYHHQKAFVFKLVNIFDDYETRTPVHVVDIEGVPVLSVYARPGVIDRESAVAQPIQR